MTVNEGFTGFNVGACLYNQIGLDFGLRVLGLGSIGTDFGL